MKKEIDYAKRHINKRNEKNYKKIKDNVLNTAYGKSEGNHYDIGYIEALREAEQAIKNQILVSKDEFLMAHCEKYEEYENKDEILKNKEKIEKKYLEILKTNPELTDGFFYGQIRALEQLIS